MLEKMITIILISLSALANLFLAFYVYNKCPHKRINKNFALLGILLFLWCVVNFLLVIFSNIFWAKASAAIVCLLMPAGIFFSSALTETNLKKITKILISFTGSILFFISFTSLIAKGISNPELEGFGVSMQLGPLFPTWVAYLIICTLFVIYILIRGIVKLNNERKNQIYYFIFGIGIFSLWALAVAVILPIFGFTNLDMLDTIGTLFVTGFTSYAIIKTNALGIRSLLFKVFINSLVIVIIIGLLAVIISIESWIKDNFGLTGFYSMIIFVSIVIFFIGRLFFIKTEALERAKVSLTNLLQESEKEKNEMSTIISNFSDGLLIFDKNNKIVIVNPEAEKMFDIKANSLIGKNIDELKTLVGTSQILNHLPDNLKEFFKSRTKINENFFLEISNIPISSEKELIGGLIILHDITDEKRIENMKSEFVSLAAHQLRTPLSGIRWALESMLNNNLGELNPEQKDLMKRTYDRNSGLIDIVNDLLNVSKIEEGKYLFEKELSNIEEIFQSELEQYTNQIKNKNINFKFEKIQEPLPKITLDKERIKIVFQNLIENAIKYTPKGGTIEACFNKNNDNIEFKIKDSGIGIPKDEKERLFEKFFRATTATKVDPGGSGLGLFISKNIIEAHHGKITAETEENKGTTFYITLPIN